MTPTADFRIGRTIKRGLVAVAVLTTAAAGAVLAPESSLGSTVPEASAAISCDTAKGGKKFYAGDDSSRTYNNTFSRGRSINHYLSNYVPQGLGYWRNWRGSTDILVVGMHHEDENAHHSLVYGLNASGKRVGSAYLPVGAHAGSVKIHKKWMYVQQNNDMIRRYNLSYLRKKFRQPGIPKLGPGQPIRISRVDVSFFDIYRGRLYAGNFDSESRSTMVRYKITKRGGLKADRRWGSVQVPKKSQGLNVTAKTFYFSTSSGRNNRSNIYVIRRGYGDDIENRRYRCFRAPVLSQDIERVGGRLMLSFEGGAEHFDGNWPWTTADNKIKSLHRARVSTLHDLVW